MTARGLHKHEGYNFCDWCHETLYAQREYGPGPGGETIEERRLREQRELEERERRLREIEEMRNRKVSELSSYYYNTPILLTVFQPEDDEGMKYHMLKIRQTMEIAPDKAYCV